VTNVVDINAIRQQLAQLSDDDRKVAIKELSRAPKRGFLAHFKQAQEIQVGPMKCWVEHAGTKRMVLVLEAPAPKEGG
jgi:hypothetical protein